MSLRTIKFVTRLHVTNNWPSVEKTIMILIFVFGMFSFIPSNLRYFPTVTGGRRRDSTTTTKSYPLPIPSVTKIEMKDSKLSCLHLLLFPEEKQNISAAIKPLQVFIGLFRLHFATS